MRAAAIYSVMCVHVIAGKLIDANIIHRSDTEIVMLTSNERNSDK